MKLKTNYYRTYTLEGKKKDCADRFIQLVVVAIIEKETDKNRNIKKTQI